MCDLCIHYCLYRAQWHTDNCISAAIGAGEQVVAAGILEFGVIVRAIWPCIVVDRPAILHRTAAGALRVERPHGIAQFTGCIHN